MEYDVRNYLGSDCGVRDDAGLPAGFTTKEVDGDHDDEFGEIQEGVNDFKVPGYKGPNPPAGLHHYSIKLYALDTKLKVSRKVIYPSLLSLPEPTSIWRIMSDIIQHV
jgi:hypothetical protein